MVNYGIARWRLSSFALDFGMYHLLQRSLSILAAVAASSKQQIGIYLVAGQRNLLMGGADSRAPDG